MVKRWWLLFGVVVMGGLAACGGSDPIVATLNAGPDGGGPATIVYTVNGEETVVDGVTLRWTEDVELPNDFELTLEVQVPEGQGGAWCGIGNVLGGSRRQGVNSPTGETGARCEMSGSASGNSLSVRSQSEALGGGALVEWEHPDGVVAASLPIGSGSGWEVFDLDPIESGVDVYIEVSGQSFVRNLSMLAALVAPGADGDALRVQIDAHPEAPPFEEWQARFEADYPVDWESVEIDSVTIGGIDSTRYRGPTEVDGETMDVATILTPVGDAIVVVLTIAPDEETQAMLDRVLATLSFDETAVAELRARY